MIRIRRLLRWLDRLSRVQHIALSGAVVAAALAIWFFAVGAQQERLAAVEGEIASLESELKAGVERIAALRGELEEISPQALLLQEGRLRALVEQLRGRSAQRQALQASSSTMEQVLGTLLEQLHGLRVVNLQRLTQEQLTEVEREQLDELAAQGSSVSGVQIDLYGGFWQTVEFLRSVESMEENFLWGNIHYVVDRYPDANIQLRFFLFSGATHGDVAASGWGSSLS